VLPIAILAGGLGTRLLPTTQRLPKALVPVRGQAFIDHQLKLLRRSGIIRVVLCVSHLGTMIEEHLGDGTSRGLEIVYSYDGPERIGTAGALKVALPLLGDRFFTTYGDSYLNVDYADVERSFEASGKSGLMTVYQNDNTLAPSNVTFRGGAILAYDKVHPTREMRYIDYGLSVFDRCAFDDVPVDRPTDLTAVFQQLLERGDLAGYESPTRFYEVGTPEGIAELEAALQSE
jgi:MurNAc alpha-1-phosphate uridylyltransferase